MVMQWGQFIDHDITLTPESSEEANCCTNEAKKGIYEGDCFPVCFPSDDPVFSNMEEKEGVSTENYENNFPGKAFK
jgi:hypothetical protein